MAVQKSIMVYFTLHMHQKCDLCGDPLDSDAMDEASKICTKCYMATQLELAPWPSHA